MINYSEIQAADISRLNIIHVAGTKGKGGTSAYIECLLRHFGKRSGFPKKTGLYTSPHLINVEERIRIDFQPLTRKAFAKYVSEVRTALHPSTNDSVHTPRYLQFLALVSFHAFIKEKVDVAVYETHHGGEYDATNVIQEPAVTAITPIDEDHIEQLGPSVENIAWHKAGIFKAGALAFSTSQRPEVVPVLQRRAVEKGVQLEFVEGCSNLPGDIPTLESEAQSTNLSLAYAVCHGFLQRTTPSGTAGLTTHDVVHTAGACTWPGRFQSILEPDLEWLLDGAHNKLSLEICAQWFARRNRRKR